MQSSYFLLISFFLITLGLQGQDLQPPIYNYPIFEYNGASQNWGVSVNKEGELFVANNAGLLYYNGEEWTLHKLPHNTIIRSVACIDNKVYTGSYEEFGFWQKDAVGKLVYTSLTHLIKEQSFTSEEFWRIFKYKDAIVFYSFSKAYIYKGDSIQVIKPNFTIASMAVYKDKLMMASNIRGLFYLEGEKITPVAYQEPIEGKTITEIMTTSKGLIIGTKLTGCYVFNGKEYSPLNKELNHELSHHQLNKIIELSSGDLAFGTIKNGVYVYHSKSGAIQNFNRETGLQNNTVLSLCEYNEQLWVGLDNGIDRIQLNSPISYYTDYAGVVGTVYDIALYQNRVYLGSNTGVYYLENNTLHFVEGSQGHVWDLEIVNGQLFYGHNTGTFRIIGEAIEEVSETSGGYLLVKIPQYKQAFLQGTYIGLSKYEELPNGEWQVSNIEGIDFPVKEICFENATTVWIAHPYKGFFRVQLNKEYTKVVSIKEYPSDVITENYKVDLFNIKNQIVFYSSGNWYKYDPIADEILVFDDFKAYKNKDLVAYDDTHFWFVDTEDTKEILYTDLKDEHVFISESQFKKRLIPDAQSIIALNDSVYYFTLSDGYGKIDLPALKSSLEEEKMPIPTLNAFSDQRIDHDTMVKDRVISIDNQDAHGLQIKVSSPSVIQSQFYYELSGPKTDKAFLESGILNFQNLPYGLYTLEVFTVSIDNKRSNPLVIQFEILPPWYLSTISKMLYGLLAIVVVLLVRKYNQLKLERKHNKLKEKLEREKEEQLASIEREKLAKEVKNKQKELAETTMNMAKKNELILELKSMLLVNKEKFSDQTKRYRTFMKKLDSSINDEEDWKVFELNFKELHEDFFENLLKKYPSLTPKDLRLCAYLKMNLTSKEIAPLMGITIRGVEIHRYRLRKKLDLASSQNISNFLITFN